MRADIPLVFFQSPRLLHFSKVALKLKLEQVQRLKLKAVLAKDYNISVNCRTCLRQSLFVLEDQKEIPVVNLKILLTFFQDCVKEA